MATLPTYVLITPARNEAQFIELTMKSVVAQTIRPIKWVIVSDGSTDGTDDIVGKYAAEQPWIELLRMPERRERHFAGKVEAFNAAYTRMHGLKYEVVVSLDGDISFDEDYFSFLLRKLAEDPALGLVGTPFKETSNQSYDYRFVNIEHVSGACQVFRRECFEEIGGYVPVNGGGIDLIAVIAARMKGWKTRTFTEKICLHHRKIGTADQGALMAAFRYGAKDYALGNYPLWEFCRSIYQMTKKPFVVRGLLLLAGYVWALVRGVERSVSREMVEFQRREQMQRLRRLLTGNRISSEKVLEHPPKCILELDPQVARDSCSRLINKRNSAELGDAMHPTDEASPAGLLIVNADDWGRDTENTERALDCVLCGAVSSVSAMVFMEDSERAATIARERGIDAGLHLNFTSRFSGRGTPTRLIEHQQRLCRFLRWHRLAPVVFHPRLASSFQYIVSAQLDEFRRIYGEQPNRIDGHHHMHLCANVVFGNLMPSGTVVRRNFSFWPGEKGICNRMYRRLVDSILQRRHQLSDFFFVLPPPEPPDRLQRIFSLARQFVVEVETHPVNPKEYRFLMEGEIFRSAGDLQIARRYALPKTGRGSRLSADAWNFRGGLICF
jgi:glycosyltransferase involved in cell wall biosynthesis